MADIDEEIKKAEDAVAAHKTDLLRQLEELRAKMYPIPTLAVELKTDYRNLKAGLRLEFRHRFVALVGDNGCGKSSLLQLLKSHWAGHYQGRLTSTEAKQNPLAVEGLAQFATKLDYCTESDSLHGKSFGDMDYLLQNGGAGISAMRMSSGQVQNMQLGLLVKQLIEAAPGTHTPALALLDEPEASLSLKMRMTLAATLRRLTQRMPVMLLVATHDESVIREADAVYDVEEGVWHQMGSYYIDALRKRTEEHIEKVYGLRK